MLWRTDPARQQVLIPTGAGGPPLPAKLLGFADRPMNVRSISKSLAWFRSWTKDQPGVSILMASGAGVALAIAITHSLVDACFAATEHWVPTKTSTTASGGAYTDGHWVPGYAYAFWGLFRVSAQLCVEVTKSPPWILLSGMVAAPSVLLTWYWRDRKRRDDHRLAVESGIAERYTRAAELLASTDCMTRINGLFSLWDVARESQSHRVTVSRTLAAFVRVHSKAAQADTHDGSSPRPDLQTAVTLLSETDWATPEWSSSAGVRVVVDLRDAQLVRFDLARKDLSGAFLRGTDFSHAYMHHAKLGDALLMEAKLTKAFLRSASLRGANLRDADLSGANLRKSDLRDAKLSGTNLRGAFYCSRTTRLPAHFDPEAHGMVRDDLPPDEPLVYP